MSVKSKEAHDHSIRNEHTPVEDEFDNDVHWHWHLLSGTRDRNRVHLVMVPHQETLGAIKDQIPFLFTKGSMIGFLLEASLPCSTWLGEFHQGNFVGFLPRSFGRTCSTMVETSVTPILVLLWSVAVKSRQLHLGCDLDCISVDPGRLERNIVGKY